MPCMCGDLYCGSCGPAQGNSQCPSCGAWEADGGCDNPEICEYEIDKYEKAMYEQELEEERMIEEQNKGCPKCSKQGVYCFCNSVDWRDDG